MTARLVTPGHPDYQIIRKAIPDLATRMAAKTQNKGAKTYPAWVLTRLVLSAMGPDSDVPFDLYTAGPCLVALTTAKPWWAPYHVLGEEFIVRYKPGNFADTLSDLEDEARHRECKALVLSSLAMIREESYGVYLKRKGFLRVSQEYMKEIPYG